MIYVINIAVDTKTTDIYDKVAINKFPIIIQATNQDNLISILGRDEIKDFVRNNISKVLYENAAYYIRFVDSVEINPDNNLILRLKDYTEVVYD